MCDYFQWFKEVCARSQRGIHASPVEQGQGYHLWRREAQTSCLVLRLTIEHQIYLLGEPGGLPSTVAQSRTHDRSDLTAAAYLSYILGNAYLKYVNHFDLPDY